MTFYSPSSKPMSVARELKAKLFTDDEGHRVIAWWRNAWWRFGGASWIEVDQLDLKRPIWEELEKARIETNDGGIKEWAPTTAKTNGLMEPLQIITRIPDQTSAPTWLANGAADRPEARNLISLANGIVNLRSGEFSEGHSPELFTTWHLPFDFDEMATCPTWDRFLGEVFDHDPNGALALQEYAGYLISGRTDLHKALMLIGVPRGGKGTISRTLQQLMGLENVASPSLSSLGGEFGMEPLIGKPFAVIEDARQEWGARTQITVERLLSIIGEDAVSVNRKNKTFWNGHLPTRFMIVSNEVPRFTDASGAILNRFITVHLTRSFADNPDPNLGRKINAELPGVFMWAMQGLARLNHQKRFSVPGTQAAVTDLMADLAQPTTVFLDDNERFFVTGNAADMVLVKDVHATYKAWCDRTGIHPLPQPKFIQEVTSGTASVSYKNTEEDGVKARRFYGLQDRTTPDSWLVSGNTK